MRVHQCKTHLLIFNLENLLLKSMIGGSINLARWNFSRSSPLELLGALGVECIEKHLRMSSFACNHVSRTNQWELRLESVKFDEWVDFLCSQDSLQLLAVQQLRLNVRPFPILPIDTTCRGCFCALAIAAGETCRDQICYSARFRENER